MSNLNLKNKKSTTEALNKRLAENKKHYGKLYDKKESFLRYPADWIVRFHNMYLKKNLPTGRVLDYGCGTGNNSVFFLENGYDVYGTEVPENALELIKKNLEFRHLNPKLIQNFSIIPPDNIKLPFKDNFFDFVLCNQVFCYLSSEEQIKKVCKELSRVLRPGGIVFFTIYGLENYYFKYYAREIYPGGVYKIVIDNPKHRLYGLEERVYVVRDEKHLKDLFSEFEWVSTGHFSEGMLDMPSNFHWIFIGKSKKK